MNNVPALVADEQRPGVSRWWLEGNGNVMLRLRCALYNGTFDVTLNAYIAKKFRDGVKEG